MKTTKLVKAVSVIGAGQMGTGIAIVSALNAQIPTVNLIDTSSDQLATSKSFVEKHLAKQAAKLNKPEIEDEIQKFKFDSFMSTENIGSSDIIIEAATENFGIKESIFSSCIEHLSYTPILATNTSSISITKLAATLPKELRPNVIGMHFMNPVPVMKLVEIIPGLETSDTILNQTKQLAEEMGKTVSVSQDSAGFIANRILMPYINEAIFSLQEQLGSKEEIDKTMELGCNMPIGPLKLADLIGLDTCLNIMQVLETELGEDKYRPCPLLKKYVYAGYLGRKTKRGFFKY
eukprot:augustus_masked-scaffold_10-processed-gene-11.51-mRNA-1 protein AED:0.01 eAED:0.01 QI:0/-1/0/1/-1/1/1/0/290